MVMAEYPQLLQGRALHAPSEACSPTLSHGALLLSPSLSTLLPSSSTSPSLPLSSALIAGANAGGRGTAGNFPTSEDALAPI